MPLLSDFCSCARGFGLGFLLCGVPFRFTFVLLSLALADKVVATRHDADDLFSFALDALDYSPETLFRTTPGAATISRWDLIFEPATFSPAIAHCATARIGVFNVLPTPTAPRGARPMGRGR